MATITRFEDLRCWKKARELVNAVYALTGKGELARDFELRDQLRRAAISAMTNISEGFARYHKRDLTTSNNNRPWDLPEEFIHFEDKPNPNT